MTESDRYTGKRTMWAETILATLHDRNPWRAIVRGVRARSIEMAAGGEALRVAALSDVIASKRAAGRPSDVAVLGILKRP